MNDDENTAMDRVASVWLTFCVISALLGLSIFFVLAFITSLSFWISTGISCIIGISCGAVLAKFKVIRMAIAWTLWTILSLSWLS